MQQIVYKTTTTDIGDLQKRLMQTWFDCKQNVIEAAIDQWRDHLRSRVHAVGGHFEHAVKLLIICIMWFIGTLYETVALIWCI